MNVKEKVFSTNIVFRCKPEEKERIKAFLCKKKKDKLGEKLREYILSKLSEEPVYEYSIRQKGDKMELTVWENGNEWDGLIYDNIDEAMKYVRSIGAIKKK